MWRWTRFWLLGSDDGDLVSDDGCSKNCKVGHVMSALVAAYKLRYLKRRIWEVWLCRDLMLIIAMMETQSTMMGAALAHLKHDGNALEAPHLRRRLCWNLWWRQEYRQIVRRWNNDSGDICNLSMQIEIGWVCSVEMQTQLTNYRKCAGRLVAKRIY